MHLEHLERTIGEHFGAQIARAFLWNPLESHKMCQCQELGKGKEGSGALEVIGAGARCLETPDSLERLFLCRAVVLCCFPPLRALGVLRTERT